MFHVGVNRLCVIHSLGQSQYPEYNIGVLTSVNLVRSVKGYHGRNPCIVATNKLCNLLQEIHLFDQEREVFLRQNA